MRKPKKFKVTALPQNSKERDKHGKERVKIGGIEKEQEFLRH